MVRSDVKKPTNLVFSPSDIVRSGVACAFVIVATSTSYGATPAQEALMAEIKAKTAILVSASLERRSTGPSQQHLSAPPLIWNVPGVLTEFADCGGCPRMVILPAGEYTMGSPASEPFRGAETQHRVTIGYAFAVGKFEITFEEWDKCVAEGGCDGYRPNDEGWGRGRQPVMNVSFNNAKAYVGWLSRKTGKPYRLLSESEWEYAARAGTTTPFAFGPTISPREANYEGGSNGTGPSDENRQKAVAVGSFPANPFGLHDMQGNVSEWVEDCWHDEYTPEAPTDGSAWSKDDCGGRVVRGGSWEDYQGDLRSAARTANGNNDQFYTDGLRVARSL